MADVALTERLNYVFQSDYVNLSTNDEYGVNQYLFYTLNDCVSLGTRLEWWKSDAGFNYAGQATAPFGTHSYYGYTSGINYKPTPNLYFRPEVRTDWSPALDFDQTYLAFDVILLY